MTLRELRLFRRTRSPWLILLLAISVAGCTMHTSKVTGIAGGGVISGAEEPPADANCRWVAIEEIYETTIFGLRVAQDSRLHQEALYYCCPNWDSDGPKCTKAKWTKHR